MRRADVVRGPAVFAGSFPHQLSKCKTSVGAGRGLISQMSPEGLEFQKGSWGSIRKHSVCQLGVSMPPAASGMFVNGKE